MSLENKWIRGAIPALLLHVCIGTVYCWSLLKDEIAQAIGSSVSSIEFAFSLAIFFLGMSASFGGRFIEKNVKKASILSLICFILGILGSVIAIFFKSVPLLFLFYGCLMGIGLGLGYLSPVKTLMIWFNKHKGLATGIAISGFGLAKVLFSPFIVWCNKNYDIYTTLISISCISLLSMSIASYLIKKPEGWVEQTKKVKILDTIKILFNPTYLAIWLIFYINITCGLALISFEKNIAHNVGIENIGLLAALTALFNALGRFGYSASSDYMKDKTWVYITIFATSIISLLLGITLFSWLCVTILLLVINAGYGGGFSTLPTLLQNRFGMSNISMIHGFALSAWAWAGLSGNQLSNLILNYYNGTYITLFIVLGVMYSVALGITFTILQKK